MPELTSREQQVAALVSKGLSNHEIAQRFRIADQTVKNHVSNVFRTLRVRNRVQAANRLTAGEVNPPHR